MKERILDPECSKVILTPSLVTEVFISVDSLEVIIGTSVPFWCQNPPSPTLTNESVLK